MTFTHFAPATFLRMHKCNFRGNGYYEGKYLTANFDDILCAKKSKLYLNYFINLSRQKY